MGCLEYQFSRLVINRLLVSLHSVAIVCKCSYSFGDSRALLGSSQKHHPPLALSCIAHQSVCPDLRIESGRGFGPIPIGTPR